MMKQLVLLTHTDDIRQAEKLIAANLHLRSHDLLWGHT